MPIVLKSGSHNLLEPSGPVQACNGFALPLPLPYLWQYGKLFLCTISREVRSSWIWRSAIGWVVSDIPSKRCQTLTKLSNVTSQKAWILSNATVRISDLLFKHVDIFEFWGFNSGVIEGCIHRRNLANKTVRKNRPWLLWTLIDEGVKVQRGGRLIWISPYYTDTSFTPLLYASSLQMPKEHYSEVEKSVWGGAFTAPPRPPSYTYCCSRMGSDAMSLGSCFLKFWRTVLPSS